MHSITAIVATYNRRDYLEQAVDALLAQTRPPEQIVIWDDGSTDGTERYAAPLAAASDGRILYRRGENRGKSAALNAALHCATGDRIWICDDDDIAMPDAAERLAAALDASGAGMAIGRHTRFRTDPATGAEQDLGTGYWPDLSQGSLLRHLLEDIFFFQNAALVRREALGRVGPFREDLARSIDYEMFVRLAVRVPMVLADGILFRQRKHDGARGPAAARHAAARSEAVWREADRAIFAAFRPVLPLALYEALFDAGDPALLRRAALLQRGCVHARRTDWPAAWEDFEAAAAIHAPGPLAPTERAILRRALAGKHGPADGFAAPALARLRTLARTGPLGREIAAALGRGAVWRARAALGARDLSAAVRAARFVWRAGGAAALRPPTAGDAAPHITERRTPAPRAYAW
ncbi:glycosyltransferase family 2 protein [Jannaschia sp. W003]|uniref:glycosyltransferase family 2 protein n=1 Tax=Jannaschia sp. W003 TaxID=2867012 RepID=UPI0021A4B6FB|nr:glycosyltransferase family 2 protein [Jannaschia sp. W003]UWQ21590.1 glycosyltransferase [Jannaschia sp. W003]